MSLHLIIGDKRFSSWSLRPALALALDMIGVPYTEQVIWLNQPDSRQRALEHSPTGKVPLLKTEHGTIADSLAIIEYLAERFPEAGLWPQDIAARAQARSACAQMHSGFMGLRTHMGFDLRHDAALDVIPADAQADIDRIVALWAECRAAAVESGPYLFGKLSAADAFFAPVAVRLRTYRVALPAEAEAYVETIYQWPAFQRWQKAGLEEVVR
ncbi:glutathione S-transferase family protein [Pseudomonas sp. UMAB-08]|uniref:glutathione S-transferase family protein n=1 Tax=Pseudomonas sp. UMAB-08 TaxID=1365375 RepID=UPI001C58F6BB|nr:glutathione S-transferase family protein [Pseudomonas sp. UMAB-08]